MSIRPHNTRLTIVLAAGALFFTGSALAQVHGSRSSHPQLTAQFSGAAGTFAQSDLGALHHSRPFVAPRTQAPSPANTQDQASLTVTPAPSPTPATVSSSPAPSASPSPSTPSRPPSPTTSLPVTTGGIYSYSQLEQLWVSVGGPSWAQSAAASVAECESGGNPNAYNPSGASGLWQILGQVVAGDIFNPTVNAENAVAKFEASGNTWAQWSCQP